MVLEELREKAKRAKLLAEGAKEIMFGEAMWENPRYQEINKEFAGSLNNRG